MQQKNGTQEVMNRATDTSLKVQETSARAGRAAAQVAGGVATGAVAALWRFGAGAIKGAIEGGKVGLGQFVQVTEISLRQAGETMKGDQDGDIISNCGGCQTPILHNQKFCGNCGQAQ